MDLNRRIISVGVRFSLLLGFVWAKVYCITILLSSLTQAFIDVVRKLKWKSMTVIYEDSAGLIKLQEILKKPPTEDLRITVRQLKPAIEDRYIDNIFHWRIIFQVVVPKLILRMYALCCQYSAWRPSRSLAIEEAGIYPSSGFLILSGQVGD